MKIYNTTLKYFVALGMLSGLPSAANAHGWSEFPSARQNTCYQQGGIWSSDPPNAACAKAKEISGTYPFIQRNEYAKNIINYNNLSEVKAAIPDGTLCYANDPQKKGMGVAHTAWTRTQINTGTFEYVFNATAPHNPSFWEFYLTKPRADLTKTLAWSDLDLIQTADNIPVKQGKYRINVTLPEGRSGDAILLVRWQRDDAAGEGFYNCSDITIVNGQSPQPEPKPTPDLIKGNLFIPTDFVAPEIGDTVKYDIINKYGVIARSFDIKIDQSNITDWPRLLASEINGWHKEFKGGAVFIGDWHDEMQHYMYFQNDSSRNFFNAKDSRASALLSVITSDTDTVDTLSGNIYELVKSDNVVQVGEKAVIMLSKPATLTQTQGTAVEIINNGTDFILVDSSMLEQAETLSFVANTLNGNGMKTFTFETAKETAEGVDRVNDWNDAKTYVGGEIVIYANKKWQAQWWVKGGNDPESTYQKDRWGVWRPIK